MEDHPRGEIPATDARRLGYFILKRVKRSLREFAMIRAGDRVAVAISGGKDSLSLLYLMQLCRESWPVPYELAAIHVRGNGSGVTAPHPPLEQWLEAERVPYRIVEPELRPDEVLPLTCQRCTWLRRKAIFFAAEEMGCNVVAFAHHADDVAETTLLNLLYSGSAWTLAPCADYFDGHFRLIRPLFYVPEEDLLRFARVCSFPPPPPGCLRAGNSRRRWAGEALHMLGREYANQARPNLIRAGLAGIEGVSDGT